MSICNVWYSQNILSRGKQPGKVNGCEKLRCICVVVRTKCRKTNVMIRPHIDSFLRFTLSNSVNEFRYGLELDAFYTDSCVKN